MAKQTSKPSAAAALPYPKLPANGQDKKFWLAVYLREVAQQTALEEVLDGAYRSGNVALQDGMDSALYTHRKELNSTLSFVVEDGRLPCAFVGTTAIDYLAVAA